MALFNVMVLNGNSYLVVAAIRDCTGHLSKAGKKDALFIAGVFSSLLLNFDAEKNRVVFDTGTPGPQKTNVVYNVQLLVFNLF